MEFLKSLANEGAVRPPPGSSSRRNSLRSNTGKKSSFSLSTPLDALHAAVVMEMLSDELEVLSATMAAPKPELRSADSILLSKEHRPKLTVRPENKCNPHHISLIQHHTTVIPRKMLQGLHNVDYWTAEDLPGRMAEAKVKGDAPGKYQKDRTYLQMIANNTVQELLQSETFSQLNKMVEVEKDTLRGFWNTCIEIKKGQARIKFLKEELQRVWEEKWTKMAELDREIFKQNDMLLEHHHRSQMEAKFVDKQVYMIVKRFKRNHRQVVKQNQEQLSVSKKKLVLEAVVHYNMVLYLKDHIRTDNEVLAHWQEIYDRDLTQLVMAIEEMVENRSRDIKRSKYIYSVIARHEPVVLEDRRLKALEMEKKQRKERQLQASIKLQAWMRGTMVRREMGPYSSYFYDLKNPGSEEEEKVKKPKKKK